MTVLARLSHRKCLFFAAHLKSLFSTAHKKRLFSTSHPRTLSPAVLWRVKAYHLEPSILPATGPKRHILKSDVLSYLASKPPPAPAEPSRFTVTKEHANGLREFVKMVDPGGIAELMLVKAVCAAIARCARPDAVAVIHDSRGKRTIKVGEPASTRNIQQAAPIFIQIVVGNNIPAEPGFTVRINEKDAQYSFEFSGNDTDLDMTRFIATLSDNISDPYLMLL
ncbi:hypothetical protein PSACC_02095 [Paramicrosporidium saccamoebae]|uniref:Peripheral subunit-binding (PSBD) domain-containing protein n=1 Tax=Paramicrosporidium saccamoebae TaxID=1246581 RepID=A0A2H9TJZ9_9FUNG|nr:hypothetical protein PSACC_02095 [Paramicrosporidium saccamoebae]